VCCCYCHHHHHHYYCISWFLFNWLFFTVTQCSAVSDKSQLLEIVGAGRFPARCIPGFKHRRTTVIIEQYSIQVTYFTHPTASALTGYCIYWRQRLWLRLGVNVDDQLGLHLNPNPVPNRNPSPKPIPNPNPNRRHLEVNNNKLTNNNKPASAGSTLHCACLLANDKATVGCA